MTADISRRLTKTIIDAVLGLNFDDPPSNLAAAALVYLLTTDVSDCDCISCAEYFGAFSF